MYYIVAFPAAGVLTQDRYYLKENGKWVHTMRMGEAHRFEDEDEAKRIAAEKQTDMSTRIIKVIPV